MSETLRRAYRVVVEGISSRIVASALLIAGSSRLPRSLRSFGARVARHLPRRGLRIREGIGNDRLCALAENDDSRALLRGRPDHGLTPSTVIGLVEDEELVPLARVALAQSDQPLEETSTALYRTLVLDRATASRASIRACFLATSDLAGRLLPTHEQSIFDRCLAHLRQDVNPYEPASLIFAARQAGVSLLQRNSDFDSAALEVGRTDARSRQAVLDVLAAALRIRGPDRASGVTAALEAWKPSAQQARAFGELCDTGFSALDPVLRLRDRQLSDRVRLLFGRVFRHVVPLIVGPFVGLGAFWASHQLANLPDGLAISPAESLGALALLVAIHVVSAQLAAQRLPGSLARFSSQPPEVVSGYSTGLVLVATAWLTAGDHPNPHWQRAGTVALAMFGVFLVTTLVALMRRTDATAAAVGFARDRRAAFISAGRRMGRIQRLSVDGQRAITNFPFVRSGGSDPRGERRQPVVARRNGFSIVRLRRIRRLARRDVWRDRKLILHLAGGLGTLVHRREELAWVIPGPDAVLTPREFRSARRTVTVRDDEPIEESAEACSALLHLVISLARQGDPGGSARVADALITLLDHHLRACHRARGEAKRNEVFPVNLALQATIRGAVRGITESQGESERAVLTGVITRALALSENGDAVITMTVNELPSPQKRPLDPAELDVLWETGARAVALDSSEMSFVQTSLERGIEEQQSGTITPLEVASRLVTLNAWLNQFKVGDRWQWYWKAARGTARANERRMGAVRIGGACLLAGCISAAISVALDLKDEDLNALRARVTDERTSAWESFLSQSYGHLLGRDPEAAMTSFIDFAQRVQAACGSSQG
jgi:hypothetical protein